MMKLFRLVRFAVAVLKELSRCNKMVSKLGSCWPVVYTGCVKEHHIDDAVLTESVAYESAMSLFKAVNQCAYKYGFVEKGDSK